MEKRIIEKNYINKSKVTKEVLGSEGFYPTIITFKRNDRGNYEIKFSLDIVDNYDSNGNLIKRTINNDREFMEKSEIDFLLVALNIPVEHYKMFGCKGYIRIVNVKGSREDDDGNLREYDFMKYELFVPLTNTNLPEDKRIWYHSPKKKSLTWSTMQNFLLQSKHKYFVLKYDLANDESEGFIVDTEDKK